MFRHSVLEALICTLFCNRTIWKHDFLESFENKSNGYVSFSAMIEPRGGVGHRRRACRFPAVCSESMKIPHLHLDASCITGGNCQFSAGGWVGVQGGVWGFLVLRKRGPDKGFRPWRLRVWHQALRVACGSLLPPLCLTVLLCVDSCDPQSFQLRGVLMKG